MADVSLLVPNRDNARVLDMVLGRLADATTTDVEVVVVQLDADASVETPGWVERMRAMLETDEAVGLVTARVSLDSDELHAAGVTLVAEEGLHDRGTEI